MLDRLGRRSVAFFVLSFSIRGYFFSLILFFSGTMGFSCDGVPLGTAFTGLPLGKGAYFPAATLKVPLPVLRCSAASAHLGAVPEDCRRRQLWPAALPLSPARRLLPLDVLPHATATRDGRLFARRPNANEGPAKGTWHKLVAPNLH